MGWCIGEGVCAGQQWPSLHTRALSDEVRLFPTVTCAAHAMSFLTFNCLSVSISPLSHCSISSRGDWHHDCLYSSSHNILLTTRVAARCRTTLNVTTSRLTAYLFGKRVFESSRLLRNTSTAGHPPYRAYIRQPWPYISVNMSDSEDDKPLSKGA
jgi:hypothetical protein